MICVSLFSVISVILTMFLVIYFSFIFISEWRFKLSAVIMAYFVFAGVMTTVNVYLLQVFGSYSLSETMVSLDIIVGNSLFIAGFTRYRNVRLLFITSNIGIFTLLSNTLAWILVNQAGPVQIAVKFLVCFGTAVIVFYFYRPLFLKIETYTPNRHKYYIILYDFLCLLMVYIRLQGAAVYGASQKLLFLLFLCIYLSYIMNFYAMERICSAEETQRLFAAQIQSFEKQTEFLEKSEEKAVLLNHDFRHLYHIQEQCLKNGDTEGALEILQTTFDQINTIVEKKSFIKPYTEYAIINAIISYYEAKMEKEDIKMTVRLDLTRIPTGMTEFAVVLSNGLENAYHACQKQQAGEPRLVCLVSSERSGQLFLELSNTYGGVILFDQTGLPVRKCYNHGYGTKSIRFFVEQNGGNMKCFTDNGRFYLRFILKC